MGVAQGICITDNCSDSVVLTVAQARKVVRIFDLKIEKETALSKGVTAFFDEDVVRIDDPANFVIVTKRDIAKLRKMVGA